MKLRQTEYCHNCQQYVEFEFDDVTDKQVIYCPNCGHEHYRELDSGTLLNIQMNPQVREVRMYKPILPSFSAMMRGDIPLDQPVTIEVETRKVIGSVNGKPVVERKETDREESAKVISERRWGRDPRQ